MPTKHYNKLNKRVFLSVGATGDKVYIRVGLDGPKGYGVDTLTREEAEYIRDSLTDAIEQLPKPPTEGEIWATKVKDAHLGAVIEHDWGPSYVKVGDDLWHSVGDGKHYTNKDMSGPSAYLYNKFIS